MKKIKEITALIIILCTVLLLALKMFNIIELEWKWVFSPIWVSVIFTVLMFLILTIVEKVLK